MVPRQTLNAHIDLLAVRFPHVHEEVGGCWEGWNHEHLTVLLDSQQPAAVIVEVKTGGTSCPRPDARRLDRAVRRLGLSPREQLARAVTQLIPECGVQPPRPYQGAEGYVGTLLICPHARCTCCGPGTPTSSRWRPETPSCGSG